jgi:ureidoglycolate hydrolase
MTEIQARRVSSDNFRPYGSIVSIPKGDPTSQSKEYRFWADIADYHIDGSTEIGLCTVYAQPHSDISGVERHIRTPEILIPVDAPFVVPLLLDGRPDSAVEAFHVEVGEAVVIHSGVWHGACLPVDAPQATYFVIFRKGTSHEDVSKKDITPVRIS